MSANALRQLPTVSFSQRAIERKMEKNALRKLVESQERILRAYECATEPDLNPSEPSARNRTDSETRELERVLSISEDDQHTWYTQQLENLRQVRERINNLQLEGDEFHVWESGSARECVFEISNLGELLLHRVYSAPSSNSRRSAKMKLEFLQQYAVEEAQQVSDQRVGEQRECKFRWTIANIHAFKIAADMPAVAIVENETAICQGGVCIEWKGWQSRATKLIVHDREEFMQVLGAHLKRYNQARVTLVNHLHELFELKQTTFDKTNEEHKKLLHRLWKAVFPNEPPPPVVSKQWTKLGFQGDDPSTDFRSTGTLSLHMLTTYAEAHPDDMRELVHLLPEREYPVAASAINLTAAVTAMMALNNAKMHVPPPDSRWDSPLFLFLCQLQAWSRDPVSDVFGVLVRVLDYAFLRLRANYMQYPQVIAMVKDAAAFALTALPTSTRQNNKTQSTSSSSPPLPPLSLVELRNRCLDHVDKNIPRVMRSAKSEKWARTPSMIEYATGHNEADSNDSTVAQSVKEEAENAVSAWISFDETQPSGGGSARRRSKVADGTDSQQQQQNATVSNAIAVATTRSRQRSTAPLKSSLTVSPTLSAQSSPVLDGVAGTPPPLTPPLTPQAVSSLPATL